MINFPSIDNNVVIIALSLLILQTVLIDITTIKGAPDTTTLGAYQCGPETWVVGDPYGTLVEQMLNDLAVECAQDPNHVKNVEYSSGEYLSGDIVAYGDAMCGSDLSEDDCKACLAAAQEFLLANCPFRKSAWAELVNCYLNYYN